MKNTVRIIAAVMLAVLAAAFVTGCTGGSTSRDYVVTELSKKIFDNCKFEDEYLAEVEDRAFALNLYNIDPALVAEKDGVKQSSIYLSSAYPEMIVCIKAVDEKAAQGVEEAMRTLIANYIQNYSNYQPAEINKLETAVIRTAGEYVVVAVTDDNAASAKYIDGIFK
jgi:hypothetical protein